MLRLLPVPALLLVLLGGCVTLGRQYEGAHLPTDRLANVRPGSTTKADILSSFGAPTLIQRRDIEGLIGSMASRYHGGDLIVKLDPALFDDVLKEARVPALVDFWAEWCGPCRMAAPEVARVAKEMAGRAVVLKVGTDRYPELAARYGVRGIPNFVVLKNGRAVRQQAGVVRYDEMKRWLDDLA